MVKVGGGVEFLPGGPQILAIHTQKGSGLATTDKPVILVFKRASK